MIYMIAALSQNHQIGLHHQMPWHIPEDLSYFRRITSGHTVIMGRKTYESIGRPLPNRRNIILTRQENFSPSGIEVIHSFEEALELCSLLPEVFIIGGGEIYELFLPYSDKLYLTLIHKMMTGDTTFPTYEDAFHCVSSIPGQTLLQDGTPFSFTLWERL